MIERHCPLKYPIMPATPHSQTDIDISVLLRFYLLQRIFAEESGIFLSLFGSARQALEPIRWNKSVQTRVVSDTFR